jgi:hypothetical protein
MGQNGPLEPSIMLCGFSQGTLPSCSAIETLERQEPFVSQVLANHSPAMLAKAVPMRGGCRTTVDSLICVRVVQPLAVMRGNLTPSEYATWARLMAFG